MNIFDIQSLIAKRRIVTLQDIDADNSYLQIGVYQPNNRKRGSGENTYPDYAIRLSDLGAGGCIDITAAEIYDLSVNGKLTPCKRYRITDYRSVNWVHGNLEANNGNDNSGLFFQPGTFVEPVNYNITDQLGFTGTVNPRINDFSIQSDGSMILVGSFCVGLTPGAPPPDPFSTDPAMIVRIDKNGILDTSFNPIESSICSFAFGANDLYTTNVLADDSFVWGGVLQGTPVFNKFIYDGTTYVPDLSFTPVFGPNTGAYYVKCSAIQTDNKILVGGNFNTLNGNPLVNFARLNANGTPDAAFNANMGVGFNGPVNTVKVQADGKIIVGGGFTTFKGNLRTGLVRLNADGTEDTAFYTNLGTGFDSAIYAVAIQNDGKILVGGDFGDLDGNTRNNLVRLNADGTEDAAFYTNLGTSFTGPVNTVMVHSDGGIVVGGSFTSFNGNGVASIVKLSSAGIEDVTFSGNAGFGFDNSVNVIKELPTENLGVGGLFASYNGISSFQFTALAHDTYEYPYNSREVYVSPETETIIVTASTEYDFEPIAYSEDYPADVLSFLPFVNSLGVYEDYQNGTLLPNGNTLSGFDLQWNGKNAYFNMPEGYPALFGHAFYMYAQDFNSNTLIDWIAEPLRPGICESNFGYYGYKDVNPFPNPNWVNPKILVSADGMTVTFLDFTYEDFLKYKPDSLYVSTAVAIAPAYGWMTRRHDTITNINVPFDYKHFKYRRYQSDIKQVYPSGYSGNTINYFNYLPIVVVGGDITNTSLITTGNYKDFYSINRELDCQSIYVDGIGLPFTYWYAGYFDNNVFMKYTYDLRKTGAESAAMWQNTVIGEIRSLEIRQNTQLQQNLFLSSVEAVFFSSLGNFVSVERNIFNTMQNVDMKGVSNSSFQIMSENNFRVAIPNNTDYTASSYFANVYTKDIIQGSDSLPYIQYFDGTSLQFVNPITS